MKLKYKKTEINIKKIYILGFAIFLQVLAPYKLFAWGERGHHSVGYTAAHIITPSLSKEDQTLAGDFFVIRKIMFGHLNNIPDIQWKDSRFKIINKLNNPTHFFDVEFIVDRLDSKSKSSKAKDESQSHYQKSIQNIETEYDRFFDFFEGKDNLFIPQKKLSIVKDVGLAPFRVGQLYDIMKSAFECAKGKEHRSNFENQYVTPFKSGSYVCQEETSMLTDLSAAVMAGGVLGHFIADLSQPYHVSVDFDGYVVGLGGAHAYYETVLVALMDEKLISEIIAKAGSKNFQESVWRKLNLPLKQNFHPTKGAFHLISDSILNLSRLQNIDLKWAVTKKGSVIAFGERKKDDDLEASRKNPSDVFLQNKFRDFTVERLALSAVVLSRYWAQAWSEAGKPNLAAIPPYAIPYPLNVPFILPSPKIVGQILNSEEIGKLNSEVRMSH